MVRWGESVFGVQKTNKSMKKVICVAVALVAAVVFVKRHNPTPAAVQQVEAASSEVVQGQKVVTAKLVVTPVLK